MYYELSPAYGRDYRTAKDAKAAFEAGQDFIGDYQTGFSPINKPQIPIGSTVLLRFDSARKVTSVKVKSHELKPIAPTTAHRKRPSIATMQNWMFDGVARATDGCEVEPDGTCEHGAQSWLIVEGII